MAESLSASAFLPFILIVRRPPPIMEDSPTAALDRLRGLKRGVASVCLCVSGVVLLDREVNWTMDRSRQRGVHAGVTVFYSVTRGEVSTGDQVRRSTRHYF